ncbi:3181_t:CDS:2, partial [Gigaspora rosea]
DYKSQMNLINNGITDTPAFFIALSRVYDYYKSGKVGEYFRNQSEKKQTNFLISLRNMKCYNCGRKGHLMSNCRSKKQDKGYKKERNSQRKNSQKIEAEKNLTKKDIQTKKEVHGNPEKTIRDGRNQRKEKTHPSLLEPKKKDSRNHHFAQKTHQDNTKRNINHLTKKNTRIRKCGVITAKQTHILPIAVINTEKT